MRDILAKKVRELLGNPVADQLKQQKTVIQGKLRNMDILLPSMNQKLSDSEYRTACDLIDFYRDEGMQIEPYCLKRGRKPDLYDRGNVWKGGFLNNIMSMVLSKKYNNINNLRLIGWHFSAFRLFDLASVVEPPANEFMTNFYTHGIDTFHDDVDSVILDAIDPQVRMEILMPRLTALKSSISKRYQVSQPARLGEVGGRMDDHWVNGDTLRYWGAVGFFERSGIFKFLDEQIARHGICRVMEIGSGYGGLGYHLKRIYGDKIQFICVDLVESLIFSSIYLTTVFDEKALRYKGETSIDDSYRTVYVPTFRSPEFFDVISGVDLCINTVSMNEMNEAQVDFYGKNVSKVLSPGGCFFEVNWKASVAGADRIDCKSYLALHFNQRISIENTEVAGDGNLDLWANDISGAIVEEARRAYGHNVASYDATGKIA
jgi:SAM-dependent methyltransferase